MSQIRKILTIAESTAIRIPVVPGNKEIVLFKTQVGSLVITSNFPRINFTYKNIKFNPTKYINNTWSHIYNVSERIKFSKTTISKSYVLSIV